MSAYAINEILYRLVHEPDYRRAIQADAAATIGPADLSEAERAAFLGGDVAALYRGGAHPFLLASLPRYGIVGLDTATYSERIHRV
jgi:hypothetical protein